jgi:predicted dithiol-disulfide oxidoreductase (DUF899 family)
MLTFAGESEEYRQLRSQLLEAEIALKDQRERVAELRRQMPMCRVVDVDYVFEEGPADINDASPERTRQVRLSELFAPGKDRLIIDHMMWDPKDELPCRMCNMWADGYNGIALHLSDKVNFALVSKVQIERLREWGRGRGWDKLRLLSSFGNSFNSDFQVEEESGQRPAVSVFSREADSKVYHFYTTEASLISHGHHRGIDPFSAVWHLFDLLPEGREMWMPKHFYGPTQPISLGLPGSEP